MARHWPGMLLVLTCSQPATCTPPSYTPVRFQAAEDMKRRKYSQLVADFVFVPMAVETSRIIGSAGCPHLTEIGRRISRGSNDPRQTSCIFQSPLSEERAVYFVLIKDICPEISSLSVSIYINLCVNVIVCLFQSCILFLAEKLQVPKQTNNYIDAFQVITNLGQLHVYPASHSILYMQCGAYWSVG